MKFFQFRLFHARTRNKLKFFESFFHKIIHGQQENSTVFNLPLSSDFSVSNLKYRQRKLQESRLSTLTDRDRNYFCFWAHEKAVIFNRNQKIRNLHKGIIAETAKIYEIYSGNQKEEHVAIHCRIQLTMYLRQAISPNADSNKLVVMFLKREIDSLRNKAS